MHDFNLFRSFRATDSNRRLDVRRSCNPKQRYCFACETCLLRIGMCPREEWDFFFIFFVWGFVVCVQVVIVVLTILPMVMRAICGRYVICVCMQVCCASAFMHEQEWWRKRAGERRQAVNALDREYRETRANFAAKLLDGLNVDGIDDWTIWAHMNGAGCYFQFKAHPLQREESTC